MPRTRFKLWHSLLGLAIVVLVQYAAAVIAPSLFSAWLVLAVSICASPFMIYVATEVIEEVRNARHMLVLLSAVVAEFIVFFAFQYGFILHASAVSFPALSPDPVTLLLQSTMVFVFNPLNMPATILARAILLVQTLGSLGLVLFILQNIWQFRRG